MSALGQKQTRLPGGAREVACVAPAHQFTRTNRAIGGGKRFPSWIRGRPPRAVIVAQYISFGRELPLRRSRPNQSLCRRRAQVFHASGAFGVRRVARKSAEVCRNSASSSRGLTPSASMTAFTMESASMSSKRGSPWREFIRCFLPPLAVHHAVYPLTVEP